VASAAATATAARGGAMVGVFDSLGLAAILKYVSMVADRKYRVCT
jgi:hypothetical protein